MQHAIEEAGAYAALELTADLTHKYTPQHFFDEVLGRMFALMTHHNQIRGIADATGLSYREVLHVHMFPELIKVHGSCDTCI